jgi:hypothetical protein
MRMPQTCLYIYIVAGSVLLSLSLAYADPSVSTLASSGSTDGSSGSMKQQQGIESYSPPSGPKAGGDATLPDPTTNKKGSSDRSGSGAGSGSMKSSGNPGIESYSPPSGPKAGGDATLPDPTTNKKGSSDRSGSGAGSGSMKSSGTGSSGGSGGGY